MPLAGRRILITRSRRQASALAAQLERLGAMPIAVPTIEFAPPTSFCSLDAALASLRAFDWILFTSANAVEAFAQRAHRQSILPSPRRIAAVGPATAGAVQGIGLAVDLLPPQYTAESLAETLMPHAPGASMLLIRAETAPSLLPDTLTAAGASITVASAYRTVVPAESIALVRDLLADPATYPDAITFTSSSTVTNLLALLEAAGLTLPQDIIRASIGPVTSRTLIEAGLPSHMEAAEATLPSLCQALEHYFTVGK